MKRKLACFLAMGLLIAAIGGAALVRAWLPRAEVFAAAKAPVEQWAAPDLEQMAIYGLDAFETPLPVIYIDTGGQRVSKENKIWASVAVLNAGEEPRSILETPDMQETITIKLRGASSYQNFDKRQYRVEFYRAKGDTKAKDVAFLGMGAHSEWVLNGPFLDKTLIRNKLIYGLGREIFEWAPDSRYVEMFLDGAYQGVYLAVEPVSNGASRLRLSEFSLLSGESAYIVKRDRVGTEVDPLPVYGKTHGKTINDLYLEYPSVNKVTQRQRDWIIRDINAFEKALYGDDFDDPRLGYARYIDVDCYADYLILNEVVMNNDMGNLSTYPYKELGGKLKIAIWDFNNSYDNYPWFEQSVSDFYSRKAVWFDRLLQDRAFVDRVVERYQVYRQGVLSTDNIMRRIDAYRQELGEAIDRNFAVWGYTFETNQMNHTARNITSYENAIAQLKRTIIQRFAFLDEHFPDLYDNCVN